MTIFRGINKRIFFIVYSLLAACLLDIWPSKQVALSQGYPANYELICPVGSVPESGPTGTSFNATTGKLRANLCVDPFGGVSLNVNLFSLTNAGSFSPNAQNDYNISNINNLNIVAEVTAAFNSSFHMLNAKTGAVNIPSTSVMSQVNGLAAYVINNSASTNAVGSFGQSRCAANNTHCWGANFLVSSTSGFSGIVLNGDEQDINVNNTTDTGNAFQCAGAWSVQPTGNMACLVVGAPSAGANFWTQGIFYNPGATHAPNANNAGLFFKCVSTSVPCQSQGITFEARDGGAGFHELSLSIDTAGNFNLASTDTTSKVNMTGLGTNVNCASSGGTCTSSSSGSVTVAAAATTVTVTTTAVTANSQIQITFDSSLGTRLGVTCNTTIVQGTVSARTAGTSFVITVSSAPVTNPACFNFTIIN